MTILRELRLRPNGIFGLLSLNPSLLPSGDLTDAFAQESSWVVDDTSASITDGAGSLEQIYAAGNDAQFNFLGTSITITLSDNPSPAMVASRLQIALRATSVTQLATCTVSYMAGSSFSIENVTPGMSAWLWHISTNGQILNTSPTS